MLENNFNELDDDFITIWSRFITAKEFKYLSIKEDLEKLAELGQVNAMQSYYLFLKAGEQHNPIIDKNVNMLYRNSFNNVLAKAYKEMSENGFMDKMDFDKSLEKNKGTLSYALLQEAKEMCLDEYEKTKNPLFLLRLNEIASPKERKEILRKLKREVHISLSGRQSNSVFANAKYLYYFGEKWEHPLGLETLKELSQRPLSKTLTDYQLQHKTDNELYQAQSELKNKDELWRMADSIPLTELVYTGKRKYTKEYEQKDAEKRAEAL